MTHIKLENLSVGYGRMAVLSGIELEINRGEIIALIGPNGSGKSTLLKTMAGSLNMISGNISIDGRSIKDYSYAELSKKIAVILTGQTKTELLSCRDVVEMGRYPYTGRLGILSEKDDEKVSEALKAVHAEEIASRDFNKISDGQRQRILLARAICQEPEIILLDEPTSFLDIKYKLEILTILRRMAHEEKITVIMSLHEIELAKKAADRIVAVGGDGIIKDGGPDEIFAENGIRKLYNINNKYLDPIFRNGL